MHGGCLLLANRMADSVPNDDPPPGEGDETTQGLAAGTGAGEGVQEGAGAGAVETAVENSDTPFATQMINAEAELRRKMELRRRLEGEMEAMAQKNLLLRKKVVPPLKPIQPRNTKEVLDSAYDKRFKGIKPDVKQT